ncbi:MAG: ABC transporter ATP-binding protein [Desulfohalobiaceae bacterium]
MEPIISADSVCKYYGDHKAVERISFSVSGGEVFGFLGPNGAGKTTTLRILTGLLPQSNGSVRVLDHDMTRDPVGAREHIGIVPEVANPYMELSGWRNMILSGELYGLSPGKTKLRAEKLLQDFELWGRHRDPAKNYSKGMKQRLILAMALLHEPQVLFLDEPTAGLDVESRHMIHERVMGLAREGAAVYYTTHHIEEANALCNRVAIIRDGEIVALDSPEALKSAFQGTRSVLVAFEGKVEAWEMNGLPHVSRAEQQGDKICLYTSSPGAVVEEVVDFARERDLGILSLNTMGPSLEDVFVSLVLSEDQASQPGEASS